VARDKEVERQADARSRLPSAGAASERRGSSGARYFCRFDGVPLRPKRRPPAELIRVAVGKERGRRTYAATIRLERRFVGRIVLVRGTRSIGSKAFGLGAGRHRVKPVLRRGVGPGWTSLRITLRDARGTNITLRRSVRLR
jgi:hypothetical protein